MAVLYIPPQMRDVCGNRSEFSVKGRTLRQIMNQMETTCPGFTARLFTSEGLPVSGLAISIDGVVTSRGLLTPVKKDSEIHILPALGGG